MTLEAPEFNEAAFIGSILRDTTALGRLNEPVDPENFSDWRCKFTYAAAVAVYSDGSTVDVHSVAQRLIQSGIFESIGGGPFLFGCGDRVPNGHDVALYGKRITEAGRMRRLKIGLQMTAEKIDRGEYGSADEAIGAAAEIAGQFDTQTKSAFEVVTSSDLASNDYALDYLIPGLLVKGQPAVLGGSKKTLKTSVLIDLALSLASGSKFLNEFYVPHPVRVGLMSGESGAATIKETAVRIARTKPWRDLDQYENAVWSFDLPRLGQPDTVRTLTKFITDNRLDVLLVDPLYLALMAGDAASNLFAMGAKLIDLTRVMRETGVTIGLAHHARKVSRSDFTRFSAPELDDLAFAGISEWARQWLLVGRRAEYDPETAGHHELWLSAGGSAGHSGLWAITVDEGSRQDPSGRRWDVSVSKASEARRQQQDAKEERKTEESRLKLENDTDAILHEMRHWPDGVAKSKLRDETGLSIGTVAKILKQLEADKTVEKCEFTAKNNQVYSGFKLVIRSSGQGTRNVIPDDRPSDIHTSYGMRPPLRGRTIPDGVCLGVASVHSEDSSPSECLLDFEAVDAQLNGRTTA